MHLLMSESGRAHLVPSTPLIAFATDSPWVPTSSNTNFPNMTRKKRNEILPATITSKYKPPLPRRLPIQSSCYPSPY